MKCNPKRVQEIEPDWKHGTWEGSRSLDRERADQMTLKERAQWLEEMEEVRSKLQDTRCKISQ